MNDKGKTITEQIIKILNGLIFIVCVILISFKLVMAQYSYIHRTVFDIEVGYGVLSDNTFTYKENYLVFIGAMLSGINMFTGCGLLGGARFWDIFVIIFMIFLAVFNVGYIAFSLGFNYSSCNIIDSSNYYNPCNDIYFCCVPAVYNQTDSYCPNFETPCTSGTGSLYSDDPDKMGLVMNWMYLVDLLIHLVYIALQLIVVGTTASSLVSNTSGGMSAIFDMMTANNVSANLTDTRKKRQIVERKTALGYALGGSETDTEGEGGGGGDEQREPFLKGKTFQQYEYIKVE